MLVVGERGRRLVEKAGGMGVAKRNEAERKQCKRTVTLQKTATNDERCMSYYKGARE